MLRRPLAEGEILQLGGAGPAERDANFAARVGGPPIVLGGGDDAKGDLDAGRLTGMLADDAKNASHRFDRSGWVDSKWELRPRRFLPAEGIPAPRRTVACRSSSASENPAGSGALVSTLMKR